MSLQSESEILEIYQIKHMHDELLHQNFDWRNNLLKKTTSAHLWKNKNMSAYLTRVESVLVLMVDKISILRNFFHYNKDKYDNNHWG